MKLSDYRTEYRLSPEFDEMERLLQITEPRDVHRLSLAKKVERKRLIRAAANDVERIGQVISGWCDREFFKLWREVKLQQQ